MPFFKTILQGLIFTYKSRDVQDVLLLWVGICIIALLSSMYVVEDARLHYRSYYIFGVAPLLVFFFLRPSCWKMLFESRVFLFFILFMALILVSGITTSGIGLSERYDVLRYVILTVSFVFGVTLISSRFPVFPWALLIALVVVASVVACYQIYDFLTTNGLSSLHTTLRFNDGYAQNPNQIALFYAPISIIAFCFIFQVDSRALKVPLFLAFISCGAIVYFTNSRGALIGLLCAIVICLVIYHRWKIFTVIVLLAFLFIISALTGVISSPSLLSEYNFYVRIDIWLSTFSHVIEAPIFGEGWSSERSVIYSGLKDSMYNPHNIFLIFLLQTGIVGLSVFLLLLFMIAYTIYVVGLNRIVIIAIALLSYVLVHGQVESILRFDGVSNEWVVFLLPISLVIISEVWYKNCTYEKQ